MSKYIVTEIQTFATGQVSNPSYAYNTREDAEAKFYTLCAAGCKTDLPVYTVMLYTNEGFILDTKCFKHGVEPEPEPEESAA